MKYFHFIFSAFLLLSAYGYGQTNIYNSEQPEIIPLWHRVADYSPVLRSVEAAEISPDGRLAVSGAKFGYQVMLWRIADGALLWEAAHESEVECVVFSPDGKRIATGGEDYYVRIWDVDTGKELASWEHDSGLDGITWSHNGQILATGSEAGDAFLWDASSYEMLGKINTGSTINSLHFTKNDSLLLVGGNIQTPDAETGKTVYTGFAKLVDVAQQKVIRSYGDHAASVKSVRISPDETMIATGSFDSTARVFNVETGELLHAFKEPLRVEAVAFTGDGQYLTTGGHQLKISFYRLNDGQLAYELPAPRTEYLDFSADGRLLLTSHEDSGLLSLYMMLSNTQQRGNYHEIADQQLNNRDLKPK
ncbi:WD40 repeat domain-containing protein [Tunicatimonas pelagia]|uniref:WD40 repeat domain-containing protein n=1 Tax=Tunicatimonas pelagia TaxID=931531 RepID=UPI002665ED52|nr:WD40 repeat domain-containing protein [Tunicatimonas pelagia]WKN43497.1 WD40 repeat domain-containing protein [Tunicatimonas pelagia]